MIFKIMNIDEFGGSGFLAPSVGDMNYGYSELIV